MYTNILSPLRSSLILWGLVPILITSCDRKDKKENLLKGRWKISAVETSESLQLGKDERSLYVKEFKAMNPHSFLRFSQDSNYVMNIGPDRDSGIYYLDDKDSLLLLKSFHATKAYFKIQKTGKETITLKREFSKEGIKLVLTREE